MRSFLRLNSWHFLRDLSTRELSRQEWGQNQPSQPAHTWNFTTCVFVCTYSMHSRLERRKREVSEYFKIDVGDIGSRLKNEVSSRCRSLCRYMSQHACRCSDINSSSIAFPLRCALPLCMLALCRVIVNSFTYASHALTSWNVCLKKGLMEASREDNWTHTWNSYKWIRDSMSIWSLFFIQTLEALGTVSFSQNWQRQSVHRAVWSPTPQTPLPELMPHCWGSAPLPPSPSLPLTVTQQLLLKIKSCCHFCLSLCEYEHMCARVSVSFPFCPLLPIVSSQYLRSPKNLESPKTPTKHSCVTFKVWHHKHTHW